VGERDTVHPWPCRRGEGTPALPAGKLLSGEGSHGEGSRASPPVPAAAAPGAAGTCASQLESIAAAAWQARREPGTAALPLLLPRRRGHGHRMDWSRCGR